MKTIKKNVIRSLFCAGIIGVVSCGEKKDPEAEDTSLPTMNEMHMEQEENSEAESVEVHAEFQEQEIGLVYDSYLQLKNALVASDFEQAKEEAAALAEASEQLEAETAFSELAQNVAASEDLDQLRASFAELTEPLQDVLEGKITAGEVYLQYCPMAFQGNGAYWIASNTEIRNPYYGDKMLKCGSVRDTLQ